MLKSTVIIPTYNRPEELTNCIESILNQSIKPNEIIVVDDGDLSELPLKDRCIHFGIHYIYFRKNVRGLTASKNAGVRLATGDVILFLDDDTVLFPDYIEQILNTYSLESERPIMGVGGLIANTKLLTFPRRLRRIFNLMFLMAGIEEGKVLPSGFSTDIGTTEFPIKKTSPVDFLQGGASSFRKEIFADFVFSERYERYGMGEDKDFAYRVSRKHKLVINPKAKLFHFQSPKMRFDAARETQEIVLGRYRLFRRCVKKGWWSWFLFCYALFGYLLVRTIVMCVAFKKENVRKVKGIFQAIKDILFGNVPTD